MFRRLVLASVAAGLVAWAYTDVVACGDKFVRAGRSVSNRRYAALHPSSILIYRPARSTQHGITVFEDLLKKAGHTPQVVERGEDIAPILAAAKYSLLIAEYSDVDALKRVIDVAPAPPAMLPILLQPNKALEAQLKRDFHCVIKPSAMTDHDALVEIDHALDFRLRDSARAH